MDYLIQLIKFPFKLIIGLTVGVVLGLIVAAIGAALVSMVAFVVVLFFVFMGLLDKKSRKEIVDEMKEKK